MSKSIGVTGTRFGMTAEQKGKLLQVLRTDDFTHWHHGRCIGVDIETHGLMREWFPETYIVVHPPIKTEHEGDPEKYRGDQERHRKSHFARNRDIVDETGGLIVIPFQGKWQPKGGTWYTHDYAIEKCKPVLIIWPDGSTKSK
jgi:hypothetical protein